MRMAFGSAVRLFLLLTPHRHALSLGHRAALALLFCLLVVVMAALLTHSEMQRLGDTN